MLRERSTRHDPPGARALPTPPLQPQGGGEGRRREEKKWRCAARLSEAGAARRADRQVAAVVRRRQLPVEPCEGREGAGEAQMEHLARRGLLFGLVETHSCSIHVVYPGSSVTRSASMAPRTVAKASDRWTRRCMIQRARDRSKSMLFLSCCDAVTPK